jgi:hypothetical protein
MVGIDKTRVIVVEGRQVHNINGQLCATKVYYTIMQQQEATLLKHYAASLKR